MCRRGRLRLTSGTLARPSRSGHPPVSAEMSQLAGHPEDLGVRGAGSLEFVDPVPEAVGLYTVDAPEFVSVTVYSQVPDFNQVNGAFWSKARESVLEVLQARGLEPTQEERSLISQSSDLAHLKTWHLRAVSAGNVGGLFA